jgi:hypothetical protein
MAEAGAIFLLRGDASFAMFAFDLSGLAAIIALT